VQDFGFRSERDHSHLAILEPVIHPHQSQGTSFERMPQHWMLQ
jgi:hypothetical protein